MKKFVLLFTGMLMIVSVFAQTNFQELTLEKALEKAESEHKKVFVDCYTSWCGPCKMMAEKVLPLKEVGEYMNERFVCIKVATLIHTKRSFIYSPTSFKGSTFSAIILHGPHHDV